VVSRFHCWDQVVSRFDCWDQVVGRFYGWDRAACHGFCWDQLGWCAFCWDREARSRQTAETKQSCTASAGTDQKRLLVPLRRVAADWCCCWYRNWNVCSGWGKFQQSWLTGTTVSDVKSAVCAFLIAAWNKFCWTLGTRSEIFVWDMGCYNCQVSMPWLWRRFNQFSYSDVFFLQFDIFTESSRKSDNYIWRNIFFVYYLQYNLIRYLYVTYVTYI
jgi:hypothetical protein